MKAQLLFVVLIALICVVSCNVKLGLSNRKISKRALVDLITVEVNGNCNSAFNNLIINNFDASQLNPTRFVNSAVDQCFYLEDSITCTQVSTSPNRAALTLSYESDTTNLNDVELIFGTFTNPTITNCISGKVCGFVGRRICCGSSSDFCGGAIRGVSSCQSLQSLTTPGGDIPDFSAYTACPGGESTDTANGCQLVRLIEEPSDYTVNGRVRVRRFFSNNNEQLLVGRNQLASNANSGKADFPVAASQYWSVTYDASSYTLTSTLKRNGETTATTSALLTNFGRTTAELDASNVIKINIRSRSITNPTAPTELIVSQATINGRSLGYLKDTSESTEDTDFYFAFNAGQDFQFNALLEAPSTQVDYFTGGNTRVNFEIGNTATTLNNLGCGNRRSIYIANAAADFCQTSSSECYAHVDEAQCL